MNAPILEINVVVSSVTLVGVGGLIFKAGKVIQEFKDLKQWVQRIDEKGCIAYANVHKKET